MKNKKSNLYKLFLPLLALIVVVAGVVNRDKIANIADNSVATVQSTGDAITDVDKLKVFYLDVGQANSELIMLPTGVNILIDGGNREDADLIIDFLHSMEVEKLDIVIATHPHEDHIGGLAKIINAFEVETVYSPKIDPAYVPTTKTYEEFLESIQNNNLKLISPKVGDVIYSDENTNLTVMSPAKNDYDDMNLYSIVTKLEYKESSFIFSGDAVKENEHDMLDDDYLEPIDVLLVGHHGSSTSTMKEFVEEIEPEYSIISCAKENDYGHPHAETIETLNGANTEILYTYENGSIEFVSDGTDDMRIVDGLAICDGNR